MSAEEERELLVGTGEKRTFFNSPNFLYALVFIQGIGVLFPWNAFITVTDYFQDRLTGSSFEDNYGNYFTFSFQAMSLACLAIATKYCTNKSLLMRIYVSLGVCLLVFLLTTIFVKVSMTENSFFGVSLLIVILAGASCAILQGGLFALCGLLQPRFTQAFMSGQGLAGVGVALLNVLTLSVGNNSSFSALLFFSCAVGVIFFCIFGFYVLSRTAMVRQCLNDNGGSNDDFKRLDDMKTANRGHTTSLYEIFLSIRTFAISVFLTFFVTLAVFPTVTAKITMHGDSEYADKYFVAVFCFVGFNVFDWIGRSSAFLQFPRYNQPKLLFLLVCARFVFIPLFMLSNVEFSGGTVNHFPQVFTGDAWPYIFMAGFAFTNGYFGSLCMMYGPKVGKSPDQAASMMAWFLTIGLTFGTLFSFVLRAVMCECNPFTGSSDTPSFNTTITPPLTTHQVMY